MQIISRLFFEKSVNLCCIDKNGFLKEMYGAFGNSYYAGFCENWCGLSQCVDASMKVKSMYVRGIQNAMPCQNATLQHCNMLR